MQQRASWTQEVPAESCMPAGLLTFSIRRGKSGGWMVWNAADADGPTFYCSTLAEVGEALTNQLMELGKPHGELPFVPQQPARLQYTPPPQQQPKVATPPPPPMQASGGYHFPAPPSQDDVDTRNLAERIASVAGTSRHAAAIAYAILGLSALWQMWPLGA